MSRKTGAIGVLIAGILLLIMNFLELDFNHLEKRAFSWDTFKCSTNYSHDFKYKTLKQRRTNLRVEYCYMVSKINSIFNK